MENLVSAIAEKLDRCDSGELTNLSDDVRKAIEAGISVKDILNQGLLAGMDRMGQKFKRNEIFIPEVLVTARYVNEAMNILRPLLAGANIQSMGRIVLGTVKGDLHDIGRHLVGILLEGAGWEVIDIGMSVPAEGFIDAARKHKADIVGLSSLLTTTMGEMKTVIKAFKEAAMVTKIIIGGAPITREFADKIGADGYAPNAVEAVELVKDLAKTALKHKRDVP